MNYLKSETTGELVSLNKEITRGGEAIIYETSKTGFVAKIYLKSAPSDTWDKLRLMISNPPHQPVLKNGHISIVWPQCILTDQGIPKGFLLPYIGNTLEFSVIYYPSERKQKAPTFNWLYLHATAMNIAACISSIHAKKYVIGDINSRNILVKRNTYVSIIDTDSFQVTNPRNSKVYRCNVGIEDYTPPEMRGKNFRDCDRHEVHDRFGLAILIWQLLFNDHPFSGKWNGSGDPPGLGEKIAQGHWVYGKGSKVKPGLRTISFDVIHPQLQALFRRCFDDGHRNPYARPSASEWQNALEVAINDLKKCSVAGEQHYYARTYGKCYWCERKAKIGVDIFEHPAGSASPNTGSSSLPTIIKNRANSNSNKPTITPSYGSPNVSPIPLPKPISISPLTILPTPSAPTNPFTPSKPTHPFVQWIQLKVAQFKASKTQKWMAVALCIVSVSVYFGWQSQIQKTASQSSANQTAGLNSDPKQTIVRYYQLATSNRKEAIKLLSDPWRREAAKRVKDNWWDSVRKVDVYAFQTFAKNNSQAKIKVWLKYHMKNGRTPCESLIFNLVFDHRQNQWLMDSVEPNSVIQQPYCDAR
ncbi:protein kinase [Limnospira fusiformis KN01]|uniref:helix-hairpin-helix domain-containing protein n=1 Tax=Limnospira TaxID=2596745 RepID=UPI00028044D8|nr:MULTISPECIES: protein kinase [Limnospira]EKD08044.1 WD-40 repeat protein [Arthrospira platensis C1]RAQ40261.1 hypothetical protein B9S53_16830 [Arthrospira sp. O9.13F]MDT9200840.1 protein kinase [Limnospira sp. PMC 1042.18]ULB46689.1 protein kinase [Limnospira fusiformis KN01]UWU47073.1 Protein kinase domain-containing protein [Arthrospira platensis C1]